MSGSNLDSVVEMGCTIGLDYKICYWCSSKPQMEKIGEFFFFFFWQKFKIDRLTFNIFHFSSLIFSFIISVL